MPIIPRRTITPQEAWQGELNHQDRVDTVSRFQNASEAGYNDPYSNPGFNPLDWFTPPEYSGIVKSEDWSIWDVLKSDSYNATPNETGIGIDATLDRIGNSNFYATPYEPVDPWDCERWPNSPYCGGNYNPFQQAIKFQQAINVLPVVSSTTCETCFTFQPSFLGVDGPITRVCYRKSDEFCSIPSNVPDEFEKNFSDAPKALSKPVAPSGFSRVLMGWTLQTDEWKQGEYKVNGVVNGGSTVEDRLEWTQFLKNGLFSDFDIEMGYGLWAKVTVIPGVIMMGDSGFPMKPWTVPVNSSPPSGSFKASIRHPVTRIPINLPGLWALNWTQDVIQVSNESFTASSGTHFEQTWILQRTEYSIAHWIDFGCFDFPASKDYQAHIDDFFNIDGLDLFYRIFLSTYVLPSIPYNPNQIKIDALGDLTKKVIGVNVSSACFIGKIKPPIPKPEPDPMDCCDEVLEQIELLQLKNNKVYRILGGDRWFKGGESDTPDLDIDAETAINTVRSNLYRDDSQADSETVSAPDMISLLAAYQAVLYQRAGFHRFPAIVPENLALDPDAGDDPDLSIVDAMSWQEWLVKQIDALQGAWPIKVKYKDEEGEESTIELHNNSEAIAEIYGLLLSVAGDVDIQTELGFKTITEAIAAKVAATTAADYAKGNAEFLGYKGNLKEKKIPLSITPGAKTLKKALETSEQKVPRWVNEDKLDLVQLLTQILFATEVVKSVFWDTFDPDRGVRGEGIKERREQGNPGDEESWQAFIDELRNPTGIRYSDLFPKPDINNLPQEERDGN